MHCHLWPSFPLTCIFWGYIPHFWTSPKSLFSGMSWCTDWNCFGKNLSGLHVDASKCTGASVPETGGTYLAGCSCEKGGVRGESWPILANLGLQVLKKTGPNSTVPQGLQTQHCEWFRIVGDVLERFTNGAPGREILLFFFSIFERLESAREDMSHLNRHDAVSFQISGGAVHG